MRSLLKSGRTLPISVLCLLTICMLLTACQPASQESLAQTPTVTTSDVLLLSGQNNHDWQETHLMLQDIIEEADMFNLTISLTPPKGADKAAWDDWTPNFASYDAVVMDYNGEMWPDKIKKEFEEYVSGGGAVYVLHASNNPFPGWTAFEEMVGILWRNQNTGTRVYMDDEGSLVRHAPGHDRGAGHGKLYDWQIQVRDTSHPIMDGIPEVWLHAHDELYHGQRGPANNMNILATAYSDPERGGSDQHELMMWWIPYGQGKVLTFLAGHHWPNQEDVDAYKCVGFRTMITRGLEWLATGEVTTPVPENFPTADKTSLNTD